MRYLRLAGSSTVRQIPDVTACGECGQPFESGQYTTSWLACHCQKDGRGHLLFCCLRGPCRGVTPDPPCERTEVHNPLEAHAADGKWDSVQEGPTLDVGVG